MQVREQFLKLFFIWKNLTTCLIWQDLEDKFKYIFKDKFYNFKDNIKNNIKDNIKDNFLKKSKQLGHGLIVISLHSYWDTGTGSASILDI